jgi:hypothetical protein
MVLDYPQPAELLAIHRSVALLDLRNNRAFRVSLLVAFGASQYSQIVDYQFIQEYALASDQDKSSMDNPDVGRVEGVSSESLPDSSSNRTGGAMSPWRFEMSYGVAQSQISYPTWVRVSRASLASEDSSEGVVSDLRVNHSIEFPLSRSQSVRAGPSLSRVQSSAAFGIGEALAPGSRAPVWRTWGVGGDFFMVRRLGPGFEIDAGMIADFMIGGVAELGGLSQGARDSVVVNRIEQKSGWRIGFCGGVGGLYAGPVGLVFRLGSYWTDLSYREHPKRLQAQGAQASVGFVLNLAKGGW